MINIYGNSLSISKKLMKFEYPRIIKNNIIKDSRGSLLEIFTIIFKEKFLLHYSLHQKNVLEIALSKKS